jgi:hypothetical protein
VGIRRVPPQADNCRRAGTPDPRAGISLKLPADPRGTGSPVLPPLKLARVPHLFCGSVQKRCGFRLNNRRNPNTGGKISQKKGAPIRAAPAPPSYLYGGREPFGSRPLFNVSVHLLQSPGRAQSPAPAPARLIGPHILFEQTGAKNLERNVPA